MSTFGKQPRLVGAALLLVVFIAGVAAGFALRGLAFDPLRVTRGSIRMVSADMSSVLDELALTPRQRAQADSILQRRAPASKAMMLEVGNRFRAISDSVDAELRSILTPTQRARLDSLRAKQTMVLRRKTVGAGGTTVVDTIIPRRR
jgi:Spy/CpxP family protein refolding chaperone